MPGPQLIIMAKRELGYFGAGWLTGWLAAWLIERRSPVYDELTGG